MGAKCFIKLRAKFSETKSVAECMQLNKDDPNYRKEMDPQLSEQLSLARLQRPLRAPLRAWLGKPHPGITQKDSCGNQYQTM